MSFTDSRDLETFITKFYLYVFEFFIVYIIFIVWILFCFVETYVNSGEFI